MLIKNNENLFVDVDSKKGYVIRLKKHEGATFTVTEDSIENTSTPPKKLVKLLYVLPEDCTKLQIYYPEDLEIDEIKWEKHWINRQTRIPEKSLLPYIEYERANKISPEL